MSLLICITVRLVVASDQRHADWRAVYTFGSGLEQHSPRFGRPGDFFTFVCFVGAITIVSAG